MGNQQPDRATPLKKIKLDHAAQARSVGTIESLQTLAARKIRDPMVRTLASKSKNDISIVIDQAKSVPTNVTFKGNVTEDPIELCIHFEDGVLRIDSLDNLALWFEIDTNQLGRSNGRLCVETLNPPRYEWVCNTKRGGGHHEIRHYYEPAPLDLQKWLVETAKEDAKQGLCHLARNGICLYKLTVRQDKGVCYRIECLWHHETWLEVTFLE